MKRVFDITFSLLGLIFTWPILLLFSLAVWYQDRHSPLYIAPRVGFHGKEFSMIKMRSMIVNAHTSGVDSTASSDPRVTAIGRIIRRYKLDELMQLFNVIKGDMSLVGPRPNVRREVDMYTKLEMKLLNVRPGITDISSIVFSDEAEILRYSSDPDIDYNQLIRPGKGELGVYYVENRNMQMDILLIITTILGILSRKLSLRLLTIYLRYRRAPDSIVQICSRINPLIPRPPYGADTIVKVRSRLQ